MSRVAVIGAGPVGLATAAHLAGAGFEVAVHDIDSEVVAPLQRRGHIELEGISMLAGASPVALATTDLATALAGARLVVLAIPASAHEAFARAAAPYLTQDMLLLIQPGQTLSAVAIVRAARAAGCQADFLPIETLSTLFTGRLASPGRVTVLGIKQNVRYAAWPASRSSEASSFLEGIFPALQPCSSVLEVGLHNANAVMHPPIALLNIGLIDSGGGFRFYVEGGSPAVMRLVDGVERERLSILEVLKIPCRTMLDWYEEAYGVRFDDLHQVVQRLPAYRSIEGPATVQTRLLLEDVPTGLVPWCSIAEVAGVEAPIMRSLVDVCSALYRRDFWREGRTLDRLGLTCRNVEELLRQVGPSQAP